MKNIGIADRAGRVLAALVIVSLLLTGQIEGVVAAVFGILVVTLLVTSLIRFCPLYLPFKISTHNEPAKAK